MIVVPVHEQNQVAAARRAAVELAQRAGFTETAAGRVAIVATELATNLVKHGRGGRLLAGLSDVVGDAGNTGVDLIAIDKGPGIADVAAALRDGFSTAGSAGHGLGAVRRQAHAFHIYTHPGAGTAILARLEAGQPPLQRWAAHAPDSGDINTPAPHPEAGAVCAPKLGEEVCGDDWHVNPMPGPASGIGPTAMVVDGLGHGPQAAEAAAAAVRLFKRYAGHPPAAIMETLHAGLRATRGAAVSIARFDGKRRVVVFCGVGNVAGALVSRTTGNAHRLLTYNGTVGHAVRRIQEVQYPYPDASGRPMIILHSDGISTNWSLDAYPGLATAHPRLIAAVLYRDFSRDRDDAAVLVALGPGGGPSQ
ncbi:MAG TPA: ATP-binding SpoIIE family protein phosphatase [Azospirillaceae bacterium]|nr:ATP-binding SpoIIE family protein phosphatase [Azospirillaceae bacterium]